MVEAACVDPKQVSLILPFAEPLLILAVSEGGEITLEEIKDGLLSGSMLLWLAVEDTKILAAVVTQLVVGKNPPEKRCEIRTIGGHQLPKWAHLISEIEKYAKSENCVAFRVGSRRKAWLRVLTDFKQPFFVLEKRL